MSNTPHATDLNQVRNLFYEAQRSGVDYPTDPAKQVTVGKDAAIRVGFSPDKDASLSRVQHGTFASTRAVVEERTVTAKMPDSTRRLQLGAVDGWLYSFSTEFGDDFELFAYFDGQGYQVMLVSPQMESTYNPHNAHLYRDGRLCLTSDPKDASGQPTLEQAYSKSVLWANGMSVLMRGYAFPWSVNNL